MRGETGSNTKEALELGRMLTAHLEPHDTLGQWMSHHLAELVTAAENPGTSVQQRQEIVETILKIWTHRYYYPGAGPLSEFSGVLTALDRLGDERTWRFSRLPFDVGATGPVPDAEGATLVETAADLERLCRETLILLLWRAAHDAEEEAKDWLPVADKLASNLESDASAVLRRLRMRLERRLGHADNAAGSAESDSDTDADDPDPDAVEDPSELDPLSSLNNSKRLRDMASLLNQIADRLAGPRLAFDALLVIDGEQAFHPALAGGQVLYVGPAPTG